VSPGDLDVLVCPTCRARLRPEQDGDLPSAECLRCTRCEEQWPIRDGMPRLLADDAVSGFERPVQLGYDVIAPLHHAAVDLVLPLLQGTSSQDGRDGYMRRVDLSGLAREVDGRPARVLEVGVGAGANLPLVLRDLPEGLDAEIWSLDFSQGMLAQCRRRRTTPVRRPRGAVPVEGVRLSHAQIDLPGHGFDRSPQSARRLRTPGPR
jgi:uncharacterized protein YbaR (Trm112 family)